MARFSHGIRPVIMTIAAPIEPNIRSAAPSPGKDIQKMNDQENKATAAKI
jgi:hypothetical protein